jgi:hypothetical protein
VTRAIDVAPLEGFEYVDYSQVSYRGEGGFARIICDLAYLIRSDNPTFKTARQRGIFQTVTDIGADKKTLYCVDKIHFRLFRPTFFLAASGHRSASAAS